MKQIKEFSNISIEDYARDWKIQRIVERTLQIMIEICVDIANHIISDKEYRTPKSYADTFRVLHEEGILGKNILKIMKRDKRKGVRSLQPVEKLSFCKAIVNIRLYTFEFLS